MKKMRSVIVCFLLISMMLVGCNSGNQEEIQHLQKELTDTKQELMETKTALAKAKEELATIKDVFYEETPAINWPDAAQIQTVEDSLELLEKTIMGCYEDGDIQEQMDAYVSSQSLEIVNAYYGTTEEMYISPMVELPDSYVFSERPVYKDAVEQGLNVAEPYVDAMSGRYIQTISKAVIVQGELIGVVGIDVYIN